MRSRSKAGIIPDSSRNNHYRGIYFVAMNSRFAAYNGKTLIGQYNSLQEAVTARNIAESEARNDLHNG